MNRERAEALHALMSKTLADQGGEWDWEDDLRVLAPRSMAPNDAGHAAMDDPHFYVFYREEMIWGQDGEEYPAYRIVGDGLIIEAGYRRDEEWIPLQGEIGKPI